MPGGLIVLTGIIAITLAVVFYSWTTAPATGTIRIGDAQISVDIAATDKEQHKGLSGVRNLDGNTGMVFVFFPSRSVRFWMVDTLLPLDLIFVNNQIVSNIVHSAPPYTGSPARAPRYSGGIVSDVIEVHGGFAAQHRIQVGDRVQSSLDFRHYLKNAIDRVLFKFSKS